MQLLPKYLSLFLADDRLDIFYTCLAYSFHRFEMLEQGFFGLRSDTFDTVQFRVYGMFTPFVSVECDGVTVHLVLYACKGVEEFRIGLHPHNDRRKAEQ